MGEQQQIHTAPPTALQTEPEAESSQPSPSTGRQDKQDKNKSDKMDAARYVCATAPLVMFSDEDKAERRQPLS